MTIPHRHMARPWHVFIMAAIPFLALGLAGCGEGFPSREYDPLDDATRVRLGPYGEETPVLTEAYFVCAGDALCKPDSVSFQVTLLVPRLCADGEKKWTSSDSTAFSCEVDEARLWTDSTTSLPLRNVSLMGERVPKAVGPDIVFEDVLFDLPYAALDLLADGVAPRARLEIDGVQVHLTGGYPFEFRHLMSVIEKEADPEARPWAGDVYANYDPEADTTVLQATLRRSDDPGGFVLLGLVGQCSGRGWCEPAYFSFIFWVRDSTHFALNLSDVEFALDSALLIPRSVEFEKVGNIGWIEARISSEGLRRVVTSSRVEYRLDTLSAALNPRQQSALRRFLRRVEGAEEENVEEVSPPVSSWTKPTVKNLTLP